MGHVAVPELRWDDFSESANWMKTMVSTPQYLRNVPRHLWTPLARLYGFCIELVHGLDDLLHSCHQGFGPDLCGSVIVKMAKTSFYGKCSFDKKLDCIKVELDEWCKAKKLPKSSFPDLTKNTLRYDKVTNFPLLDSKAFDSRIMVAFLRDEAHLFAMAYDTPENQDIALCLSHLGEVLSQFEVRVHVFCVDQAEHVYSHGMAFLAIYSRLAQRARDAGESFFKVRFKLHYFCHLILFVRKTRLNPGAWSCWMDEDMMGKFRLLCGSCNPNSVATIGITRWLTSLDLEIREMCQEFDLPALKSRCV